MRCTLTMTATLLAAQASGQMLDLSGPPTPGPGEGPTVLRTARELLESSSSLLQDSTPTTRARAALRRVAARAIRLGDQSEPDGSALTLLGLTIARQIEDLDRRLAAAPEYIAAGVASDLDRLLAESPADVRAWEQALQFALATLFTEPVAPGWALPERTELGESVRVVESLRADLAADDASSSALAGLDAALEAARSVEGWPSYHQSVATELDLIVRASRAVSGDHPWLTQAARDRLHSELGLALRDESARSRHDRLRVLAFDAELLEMLSRLPRDGVSRDVRERFVAGIASRSATPTRLLETMPRAIDVLARAGAIESLPHERELVRELRLLHRAMLPELRQRAKSAREAAAILATSPNNATDPGTLSTLAAFDEMAALSTGLIALNARLAAEGGGVVIELQSVAERLQSLGRDAQESSEARDEAFALLTMLLEQHTLTLQTGELLPIALAGREAGDQLSALVAQANSVRGSWNAAWSTPGGRGLTEDALTTARQTHRLLLAMADLGADASSLNGWSWWELSQATDRASGADAELDRLTRRFLAGTGSFAREMGAFESEYAARLLAGRLARLTPSIDAGPGEIVTGAPPRDARFESQREQLATVCRYEAELGSPSADPALKPYIASIALPLREALPAISPD